MHTTSIQELADVLLAIKDRELMVRFLGEIMTPAEIETFALRWESVKLLHRGVPQREISKRLGISLCKITRGSRELKKASSAIRALLDQSGFAQKDETMQGGIDDQGIVERG